MRLREFDFELPVERIATRPTEPRENARLLHVGEELADRRVFDLPDLLRPGDLMVVNDTRVIPAQLFGTRGEVHVEVTLIEASGPGRWRAFARPARRLRPGDTVRFAQDFEARVLAREGANVELDFQLTEAQFARRLARVGTMPIPPYIRSRRAADAADAEDYQTMFAEAPGAVAAPTAGLHFTPALMERLARHGIETASLTLHVGPGTFLPVTVEEIDEHPMMAERGILSEAVAGRLNATRAAGGRILAVGSTSLRLVEAAADDDGRVAAFDGRTDLFIRPGYRFKIADMMMTNFHLPRSTLFMLVAAFVGLEKIRAAYGHAIRAGYRFYSYGDACLLERAR